MGAPALEPQGVLPAHEAHLQLMLHLRTLTDKETASWQA